MADITEQEQSAKDKLEFLVKNYKVFIDTCSIIDSTDLFWNHIKPLLKQYNKKLILPQRCIDELLKKSENKNLCKDIKNKMTILKNWNSEGLIDFRGNDTDNFADNVFTSVFAKFRLNYNLLLITQDKNLAKDVFGLNFMTSQKSKYKIKVYRINRYGYLNGFNWEDGTFPAKDEAKQRTAESRGAGRDSKTDYKVPVSEQFRICTSLTSVPAIVTSVSHIPCTGESVYTADSGHIQLRDEIARGGEGILYETHTKFVAKIYFKEKITRRKEEKIRLMTSKPFNCNGVCWPITSLYNGQKQFVGFLMSRASGKEIQKCLFIKPQLEKNFPNWKKKDLVELCITILKKIKYLHDRNIILGDINPLNIMIKSSKEVYFVDTDSYQIEDFPCPVGTINYTAPEIQKKKYTDFLRTKGNENFAVATLLFMIMLPGKPPYSQQGGESPIDNIVNMDFSYPLGDSSNKKTPIGPWRYIWSHLPYFMKEAFYKTFRKGEDYASEKKRLSVEKWLHLFEQYYRLLVENKLGEQDSMSEDLFPTRFKQTAKTIYEKRNCIDCGEQFIITKDEYAYFTQKALELPKRCGNCRKARKSVVDHSSASVSESSDIDFTLKTVDGALLGDLPHPPRANDTIDSYNSHPVLNFFHDLWDGFINGF